MTRVELLKRLDEADIAFAEVNTMADLAVHPHLRRIEVDTPKGKISYAAPAAIFVGEPQALWRRARHRRARRTSQAPAREPEVMTAPPKNSTSTICANGSAAARKRQTSSPRSS